MPQTSTGMVKSEDAMREIWQMFARSDDYESRQKWLAMAGWDVAGWALMNWHQLPKQLQHDLTMTGVDSIEEIINTSMTKFEAKVHFPKKTEGAK